MCKTQITSQKDVEQFTQMFVAMYSQLHEQDLRNIYLVQNFTKWLIAKGMKFCGNWEIEDQMLFFSSLPSPKFPIKITFRFESGLKPLCFWIKGALRDNRKYDETEHDGDESWFVKTFEEYH